MNRREFCKLLGFAPFLPLFIKDLFKIQDVPKITADMIISDGFIGKSIKICSIPDSQTIDGSDIMARSITFEKLDIDKKENNFQ